MVDLDAVRDAERREDIETLVCVHLPALLAEVERLRAELTTTLVACERCKRAVRARYAIDGVCPECLGNERDELQQEVANLNAKIEHILDAEAWGYA